MNTNKSVTTWISLSDLMTALMLIFLFLAIVFMAQMQKTELSREKLLVEYDEGKQQLYDELDAAFKDKYSEWEMELDRDLTIRFKNPDVLFAYLSSTLTERYQQILDEFLPAYITIINQSKYADKIKEVRIEGHTASWPDYMYTIKLSQERSNSVLRYLLASSYFNSLSSSEKEKLQFWITSNGLGLGHAVDEDGNYTYVSKKPVTPESRRVEFRIVTTSEELVERLLYEYRVKQ